MAKSLGKLHYERKLSENAVVWIIRGHSCLSENTVVWIYERNTLHFLGPSVKTC